MNLLRNSTFPLFVTLLLLHLPSNQVKSQTVLLDPPEIYIGVSGGATGSMILFNPRVQQTFLLGYNGGVAFRYITEKSWGLQAELNYSQRGWKEDPAGYSRQLNYLEIPFLTHFYMGDKSRFIFNLGPKIGFLLNEKALTNEPVNTAADQQILPVFYKFDYGITAGLGYNLKTASSGVFQFELRAYYGLADVFPNTKKDFFSTSNHINASINLGYFFQLTGK